MKLNASILSLGLCAIILTGCGGTGIQAPSTITRSAEGRPDRSGSWMAPEAKGESLIYVSETNAAEVAVLSYPDGSLVGTLSGLDDPGGECVDSKGDVFITEFEVSSGSGDIVEYAHGGTQRIATLEDTGYYPNGCAVDPKTGNLAVTNWHHINTTGGPGDVSIYTKASGTPTHSFDPQIYAYYWCSYDASGNLYLDGVNSNGYQLAELPEGSANFVNFNFGSSLKLNYGGLQWRDGTLAVGFGNNHIIYRVKIEGSLAITVGQTKLRESFLPPAQFWIQGRHIVAPDLTKPARYNRLGIWTYPRGHLTRIVKHLSFPWGVVVSNGSSR